MMRYCQYCGSPLEEGQKFCSNCGAKLYDQGTVSQQGTVSDSQNVNTEQIRSAPQYYTYAPQPPARPKKKLSTGVKVVIALACVIVIAAVAGLIVLGFLSETTITVEYDSGFEDVICEDVDGYHMYTPVMKDGYIFDYWMINGERCDQKILSISGGGTIVGHSTPGYTVTVYSMYGLKISDNSDRGDGDFRNYQSARLTVTNDITEFRRWCNADGTPVADSPTSTTYYVPDRANTTILAEAKTNARYDGDSVLSVSINGTGIDPATSSWIILEGNIAVDWYRGVSSIDRSINPGSYTVLISGKDSNGNDKSTVIEKEVTGTYRLTYSWRFNSSDYEVTWTVPYSDYKASKELSVNRAPSSDKDRRAFAEKEFRNISVITDYINGTTASKGWNDEQRANFVLAFVQQCFQYQYDSDYNGRPEYWKYSLETMVDQRGDCEDTSILYCNIMRALGHETALLLFEYPFYDSGHAMAGIYLPDAVYAHYFYEVNGKKYYTCETTAPGYDVGDCSAEYDEHCNVVTIPAKS